MPCGWGGNRRYGDALAMRHRLQWFIHPRAWRRGVVVSVVRRVNEITVRRARLVVG